MANQFHFCPNCGKKYPLHINFCNDDGANLRSLNSASASNQNNQSNQVRNTPRQEFQPFIAEERHLDDDNYNSADNYHRLPSFDPSKIKIEIIGLDFSQAKETVGGLVDQGLVFGQPPSIEKRNIVPQNEIQLKEVMQTWKNEASALKEDSKTHTFKSTDVS